MSRFPGSLIPAFSVHDCTELIAKLTETLGDIRIRLRPRLHCSWVHRQSPSSYARTELQLTMPMQQAIVECEYILLRSE